MSLTTAKKKAAPVLETLRIIEAAGPPKSELPLTANEKALKWEPVIAVGPQDSFGLSQGNTVRHALRFAAAAGALACTRLGAQSSVPTMAEVGDFLALQPPANTGALEALGAYCGLAAGTYS